MKKTTEKEREKATEGDIEMEDDIASLQIHSSFGRSSPFTCVDDLELTAEGRHALGTLPRDQFRESPNRGVHLS